MNLGNLNLGSTFGLQVMSVASGVQASTVCQAISGMAAALVSMHGESWAAAMRAGHASAMEWNALARMNGCPDPWMGAGSQDHPDVALVDAAIKRAVGGGTNPMNPPSATLPNQSIPPGLTIPTVPPPQFFSLKPEAAAWTKLGVSAATAGDVLRAAQLSQPKNNVENVAPFPATGGLRNGAAWALGARWAGYWGGKWQVEIMRGPDFDVSGVDCSKAANQVGCSGVVVQPPDDRTGMGGDLVTAALGPGTPPKQVVTRRCPGRMRLAINGSCYDKSVIPAKWRMNKERRAVISYSEGQQIVKGFRAAERIDKLAKKTGMKAKKIAPKPRPRRRRIPARTTASNAAGPPRITVVDTD